MVLLVRELTHNLPSLTKIELYRNQIRLDDAKSARLATASGYLGFTLCEQSTSDTLSAVLPKHPQVINPLLARYYDSENPSIGYGYPRRRPVFIFELQRDRIRSKEVAKCLVRYDLYQSLHRVVLVRLRSPDNHLDWHTAILSSAL